MICKALLITSIKMIDSDNQKQQEKGGGLGCGTLGVLYGLGGFKKVLPAAVFAGTLGSQKGLASEDQLINGFSSGVLAGMTEAALFPHFQLRATFGKSLLASAKHVAIEGAAQGLEGAIVALSLAALSEVYKKI